MIQFALTLLSTAAFVAWVCATAKRAKSPRVVLPSGPYRFERAIFRVGHRWRVVFRVEEQTWVGTFAARDWDIALDWANRLYRSGVLEADDLEWLASCVGCLVEGVK